MLGVSFASLYASATTVWPTTYANTTTRNRPDTRDNAVPEATTRLEVSNELMGCPRRSYAVRVSWTA